MSEHKPVNAALISVMLNMIYESSRLNQTGDTWAQIEIRARERMSHLLDGGGLHRAHVPGTMLGDDVNELARAMQVDRLMGERDEAHAERDKALEALRIESVAAQDARQHMRLRLRERDDTLKLLDAVRDDLKREQAHASTWRETAKNTAQERDKALDAYNTLRQCMAPHPDHSRLAELEARNVELRQMLEQSQQDREMDVIRLTRDRDGFRRGAQFWMDSSKDRQAERDAAEAKVVKLRTVLQNAISDPFNASLNHIKHILEETK